MTYDMSEFALTNREWDVMDFASGIDHALGGRDSQRTRGSRRVHPKLRPCVAPAIPLPDSVPFKG